MPDPTAPIYVDEDADEDIARALAALGHDALSTRQDGNKGQDVGRCSNYAIGA